MASAALALGGIGASSAFPSTAIACGGTFCDAGLPTPMPVPQTGETIVFVADDEAVEAHIRIEVDAEADVESFAWLIPVQSEPDLGVGSEPFMDALLEATGVRFSVQRDVQSCPFCEQDGGGLAGGGAGGSTASATFSGGTDDCGSFLGCDDVPGDDGAPPLEVRLTRVGAFDAAVLSGGSLEEVTAWLDDNGFARDETADPIVGDYLASGHVFLALRLVPDATRTSVHPLVIRYAGSEPCIPLRLTAIAARDDMPVRALFLDRDRFVPANWPHVVLNEAMLDWSNVDAGFMEAVTLAVDEADGHGWVTEMAGPTPRIDPERYLGPNWDAAAFVELGLYEAIRALSDQGFVRCETAFDARACSMWPPPVAGAVEESLTLPAGQTLEDVVAKSLTCATCGSATLNDPEIFEEACVACGDGMFGGATFDGPGFAEKLQLRVIEPALRADELLSTRDFVTRMVTTISAHEMTEDPTFQRSVWMDDVSNAWTAQTLAWCHGWTQWSFADGLAGVMLTGTPWDPSTWPDDMPFAARIEQVPPSGPPNVLVDNTNAIRGFMDERAQGERFPGAWPGGPFCEGGPLLEGEHVAGSREADQAGCACAIEDAGAGRAGALGLATLGLLTLVGRRRRPRGVA